MSCALFLAKHNILYLILINHSYPVNRKFDRIANFSLFSSDLCYDSGMNDYGWNGFEPRDGNYRGGSGRSHSFETAALILGIIGLFAASCGMGIFFGALAILFGCLSKGGANQVGQQGRVGIWLGIAAMIATAMTLAFSFVFLITQFGGIDGFLERYRAVYDALNSGNTTDFAELYNILYGAP